MVNCLCKLHNFCINETTEPDTPFGITASDRLSLRNRGSFDTEEREGEEGGQIPFELLHGGDHFDDDPEHVHQRAGVARRRAGLMAPPLPCEVV
jgi:hypothetical protein